MLGFTALKTPATPEELQAKWGATPAPIQAPATTMPAVAPFSFLGTAAKTPATPEQLQAKWASNGNVTTTPSPFMTSLQNMYSSYLNPNQGTINSLLGLSSLGSKFGNPAASLASAYQANMGALKPINFSSMLGGFYPSMNPTPVQAANPTTPALPNIINTLGMQPGAATGTQTATMPSSQAPMLNPNPASFDNGNVAFSAPVLGGTFDNGVSGFTGSNLLNPVFV